MVVTYKQSFKQTAKGNIELSVYNCGLQRCEKGYSWGPGVRDHFLIHFIANGCGTYTVGGKTWNLKKGDVFLARPSQLITYQADQNDPWEYYWVGFNGSIADSLVLQLPFTQDTPVHSCRAPEKVRDMLFRIFLSRGPENYSEAQMAGYLYLFLGELMKESAPSGRYARSSSEYVTNAVKFIQYNYSHDITVDDIASAVGVSRSHLYRVFMEDLGESPITYLTDYRINEACYLLRCTGLSISEIAASVGFCDQFYFSRVFKRCKGIPPSRYPAGEGAPAK